MPHADYLCPQGHHSPDVKYGIKDSPVIECPTCGEPAERQIGLTTTVYKGNGWISRDLRRLKDFSHAPKKD